MKTRNQILLNKLKDKYPNLNIDKPIYDDNYWDSISNSLKSEEKLLNLKPIGSDVISQLVDNNTFFWKEVNDMINETIKVKYRN